MDKVKVIWVTGATRNEKIFDSLEEAEPLMRELDEKGELWFWDWTDGQV